MQQCRNDFRTAEGPCHRCLLGEDMLHTCFTDGYACKNRTYKPAMEASRRWPSRQMHCSYYYYNKALHWGSAEPRCTVQTYETSVQTYET